MRKVSEWGRTHIRVNECNFFLIYSPEWKYKKLLWNSSALPFKWKVQGIFHPIKSHTMHVVQVCHTFCNVDCCANIWGWIKFLWIFFFSCLCQRWNWAKNQISKMNRKKNWLEKSFMHGFLCSYCLTPLKHHLMCSPWFMIDLKISHFISIWFFHIAALKTQPYDLLRWSAAYFRCLSMDVLPPVKPRYEQEIALGCLTKGYLKVLLSQVWMSSCMNMCKTTTIRQKAFSVLLKI